MSRGASDWRVEWLLRAIAVFALAVIGLIAAAILIEAWPSFAHNGIRWFFPGGDVDQQLKAMITGPQEPGRYNWHFRGWPLIWGTILTSGFAVLFALPLATLAAIFIVEIAPARVRRVVEPAVWLLAGVPSVVYGLVGLLVIVPWVEQNLISRAQKHSVDYVVQLTGENVSVATAILTVMILPIMVALIVRALQTVPRTWTEGSVALGVNRWRTIRRVSLRAARPAIIAAAVLAMGRALGESIMLSMVSGSRGFAANPLDGVTFFFEPVRPLAATIIDYAEGISVAPLRHTLYAMGAVLLVSTALFSLAGWAVKQPLKRYGIGT